MGTTVAVCAIVIAAHPADNPPYGCHNNRRYNNSCYYVLPHTKPSFDFLQRKYNVYLRQQEQEARIFHSPPHSFNAIAQKGNATSFSWQSHWNFQKLRQTPKPRFTT